MFGHELPAALLSVRGMQLIAALMAYMAIKSLFLLACV
jgi:hypothetical protein